jgi:hypothetical protein
MNETTTAEIEREPRAALVSRFAVLLVISFVLLSTVALEQDKTIRSQCSLIRLLLQGHLQLSRVHSGIAMFSAGSVPPSNQARALELPPNLSPSTQAPAVKVKPPITVKPGRKSRRAQEPFPGRPPTELSDPTDMRRVSFSI